MTQHFNRRSENLKRKHLRHNTSKAENELFIAIITITATLSNIIAKM